MLIIRGRQRTHHNIELYMINELNRINKQMNEHMFLYMNVVYTNNIRIIQKFPFRYFTRT